MIKWFPNEMLGHAWASGEQTSRHGDVTSPFLNATIAAAKAQDLNFGGSEVVGLHSS